MKPQVHWRVYAVLLFLFAVLVPGNLAQQATFATPILVVNTSFLNVRTGPGAEYSILVTVVGGTELPVLGVAKDLVWYQVATDAGVGWANVRFTLARGEFSRVPFAEAPVVVAAPSVSSLGQGGGGVAPVTSSASSGGFTGVALDGGNLRTEPNPTSLILFSGLPVDPFNIYPLLNAVTVNGTTWYNVNVPAIGNGWTDKISLRLLACNTFNVGVTKGEATIRFDGIAARDSYQLARGSEFFLKGFVGSQFFLVEDVHQTEGLIAISDIEPRPANVISRCDLIPAGSTGVSTSTMATPAMSAGQGGGAPAPVPVVRENIAVVNTGNLNVRSGPSFNFASVAVVPGGTQLRVLGIANDRVWMYVEGTFGKGWINQEFILFRGNPDTVPTLDF